MIEGWLVASGSDDERLPPTAPPALHVFIFPLPLHFPTTIHRCRFYTSDTENDTLEGISLMMLQPILRVCLGPIC